MPATVITLPAVDFKQAAQVAVYTKANWADDWVLQPLLHCRRLAMAAAPAVSTATFHWRIGDYLAPGSVAFKTATATSINVRSFVKVVATGSGGRSGWTWYGIWKRAELRNDSQEFQADGLESLLNVPCLDAFAWDSQTAAPVGGFYTGQGLPFNEGGRGNRTAGKLYTVNGQTVYAFRYMKPGELETFWDTQSAVEYLLALAAPKDESGAVIFNWTISGLTNLPNFDKPEIPTHGRTFLSLLTALVSRFRLTSFSVSENTISFFTFAESAVTLTDNDGTTVGTIPANSSQISINLARDQSANATISTEAAGIADRVTVYGDYRQSVFSLRAGDDSTLEAGWDSTDELAYKLGASLEGDYPPATEQREREERDKIARNSDRYRHVFARLTIPADWDQQAGDCEGGTKYPICIDDDDAAVWQHVGKLEFLKELPFLTGYDYDGSTIADNSTDEGHRGDKSATVGPYEPLPIIGIIRVTEAGDSRLNQDAWDYLDQVGRLGALEAYKYTPFGLAAEIPERRWSARVRPIDGEAAVEVRVVGEEQHALAKDELIAAAMSWRVPGALDWKDIILTVAINDSRQVQVQYPATISNPVGQIVREMRVDAPGHKLIYVVPGTVVGIYPATATLAKSTGGYLQDDRNKLMVIAQRVYQWHKTPRYSLGFSSCWLDSAIDIGDLVTAYTDWHGTWPVLSVVTEITLEFPVSEGKAMPPVATYVTAFGELDPLRAV